MRHLGLLQRRDAKGCPQRAARSFAQPPGEAPTIEAETEVVHDVAEPTQEDMLTDLLEAVADSDAENLGSYVEQANAALTGAKLEMVKKAIQARAKALGVKWDKEKGDSSHENPQRLSQGSEEWFALRRGRATASNFKKIITPAKGEK